MTPTSLDSSARFVFDALVESATGTPAAAADETARPLAERIAEHWDAARVVSFDVFDTALVRKLRTPKDVFLFLYALPPLDALGERSHDVARLRETAESAAGRNMHAARGTVEVTLPEIYAEMLGMLGADEAEDVVPALVDAEETVEMTVCAPHPVFLALYRRARAEGKQVWFVSDTYHSAAFLRRLLAHNGYDGPGDVVATSADERMSKGEGRLFGALLARRGVAAGEVLHVGDHPASDGSVPRAAGIRAVHHPLAATTDAATLTATAEESLVRGLAAIEGRCHEPARSFWWRFGYATAGPALAGFALWLHEELRRDGVRHAHFLLRDGEILQRVYDVFGRGRGDAVPSSLLHSSRRAFMMPALSTGSESVTSQLFVSSNPRPVSEFLTRLDVPVDGLDDAFRRAGFSGPDELVGAGSGHTAEVDRLAALFTNPAVAARLGARSAHERALLLDYLRQEGVLGRGRAALVDVGWNGTIQKCLTRAAAAEGVAADVVGYYFGSAPGCGARDGQGMQFRSYLFHLGEPRAHYRAVFSFLELMELICSGARGSLRRFERAGGRVVPVCEAPELGGEQMAAVAELHEGAVAFAEALRGECERFDLAAIPPAVAGAALLRVIAEPTPEEAETVGRMQHGDGMGSATAKYLARFTDGAIEPAQLLADYRNAYWRSGLLGQRTPQAMVLRNLLWLAGR